jgi:hypothetical protein
MTIAVLEAGPEQILTPEEVTWGDFQELFTPMCEELETASQYFVAALWSFRDLDRDYTEFIEWSRIFCERCRNGL